MTAGRVTPFILLSVEFIVVERMSADWSATSFGRPGDR
jgi:hypothetical protein